jgi:ammonium transporter, Amt family
MRVAPSRLARWPPAPSWLHTSGPPPALGWAGAEWVRNGKPSVLGAISGSVAGLVAITPASGFVGPMSALAIGLAAGVLCYLAVARVKGKFGYDDSLDAFGVHGVGGTVGALLTGVFASRVINPIFKDTQGQAIAVGLIDGHAGQVANQLVGVTTAIILAIFGTLIILKLVDSFLGLRVPEEHEIQGLDVSQHGEEGYNLEG